MDSRPLRRRRWLSWSVFAMIVAVAVLLGGTRWGDKALYPPTPGSRAIPIFLVSNGFHSGLILPRPEVARAAERDGLAALLTVATRFGRYDWLEAGWGEDRFYRGVPTVASLDWGLALRALFAPGNLSVMHMVGVEGDPRPVYRDAELVKLDLSAEGFDRLVAALDRSFARDGAGVPEELGPGLYGPSLFYRAVGTFNLTNVCNHWTARLLDAAGVSVSPIVATVPRGLVLDLQLRSGLFPEARDLSAPALTH